MSRCLVSSLVDVNIDPGINERTKRPLGSSIMPGAPHRTKLCLFLES